MAMARQIRDRLDIKKTPSYVKPFDFILLFGANIPNNRSEQTRPACARCETRLGTTSVPLNLASALQ
jgi:hypothetical protein